MPRTRTYIEIGAVLMSNSLFGQWAMGKRNVISCCRSYSSFFHSCVLLLVQVAVVAYYMTQEFKEIGHRVTFLSEF